MRNILYNIVNPTQDPGNFVEKMGNFLASRRWLGFLNYYSEVGLESAYFIGWYPPSPNIFRQFANKSFSFIQFLECLKWEGFVFLVVDVYSLPI
jgi:hypothetical protein